MILVADESVDYAIIKILRDIGFHVISTTTTITTDNSQPQDYATTEPQNSTTVYKFEYCAFLRNEKYRNKAYSPVGFY